VAVPTTLAISDPLRFARDGILAPAGLDDGRVEQALGLVLGSAVDVLVARSVPTVDGVAVRFDDLWTRRQSIELSAGVALTLPSLADLIQTKRFGGRPRDLQDIEYLKGLLAEKELER